MIDAFIAAVAATSLWQWIGAFLVLTITDVCWALYTKSASSSRPIPAAGWAVALFVLGGMAVVGYTTHPILLIPSAVGAFVGTYIGVSWSKKDGGLV